MLEQIGDNDQISSFFALFELKDRRVGAIVCFTVLKAPN